MSQVVWRTLGVRRHELGVDGFGVLACLIGVLEYHNTLPVSQKSLGDELGMCQQQVSRAMKRLVSIGLLIEGAKCGLYRSYRLNPEFAWKGAVPEHHRVLKEQRKASRRDTSIEDDVLRAEINALGAADDAGEG